MKKFIIDLLVGFMAVVCLVFYATYKFMVKHKIAVVKITAIVLIFIGGMITNQTIRKPDRFIVERPVVRTIKFQDPNLIRENNELSHEVKELQKSQKIYISQGVNATQYRNFFEKIFTSSGIFKRKEIPAYVDLIIYTAQVESDFGRLIKQQNNGPALGWFQIESYTEKDIWDNYITPNKKLREKISAIMHKEKLDGVSELQSNLAYSAIMCAMHYKRYIDIGVIKLPNVGDRANQAYIWKKIYNTKLGKGTKAQANFKAQALNSRTMRVVHKMN